LLCAPLSCTVHRLRQVFRSAQLSTTFRFACADSTLAGTGTSVWCSVTHLFFGQCIARTPVCRRTLSPWPPGIG
jgi:hypothetical protein